jgi:hypothetical protein
VPCLPLRSLATVSPTGETCVPCHSAQKSRETWLTHADEGAESPKMNPTRNNSLNRASFKKQILLNLFNGTARDVRKGSLSSRWLPKR